MKLNSNNKFDKFSYYNLWFKESCGQWGRYRKYLENQDQERSENISILSDDPIRYKNDDLFGYKNIADNVYKLICGIDPKDGAYSIGIIGEWGLGKSSIIGILEESNLNLDSNIITYKFNPWNYNKNDLVERFITDISGKINIRSISKELSKYMESLSSINSTTGVIHKLYNIFQKNEGLDDIRSNISEKLKALGKKFVIIIDDLDRCEPDEVILMLNIIKNIGNFNNIIYVISFDKIHLIESLKSKGFNKDYIEKIINSEIHLPIPSKEKKAIYFKEKFYEILTSVSISESIIHESCRLVTESGNMGLDEIFENNNLRFIKKLLNSLNVNFKLRFNEDKDKIRNLHQIDIANIILINYIKIKDISFYNDSIFKKTLNERTLKYKSPNKPVLYNDLNEKKIHERFLNLILGMRVGLIDNGDSLYIENTFFSSDPQIKERINHNWELLNEYS